MRDAALNGSREGAPAVRLPRAIADAIAVQARAELPNEACGIVIGSAPAAAGGAALRYVPCRNRLASRYRYEVHPEDLVRTVLAAEEAGEIVWGIAHSHVASPAVPSATDIELARWPDAVHLVASLGAAPSLRAWRIADGVADELPLEIG